MNISSDLTETIISDKGVALDTIPFEFVTDSALETGKKKVSCHTVSGPFHNAAFVREIICCRPKFALQCVIL